MKTNHGYIAGLLFFAMVLPFKNIYAVPFGSFDPRALAMGGAGVASGNSVSAAYFNPALMAMYETRKELGGNSRFILPLASARVSRSYLTVEEVEQNDTEQDLTDAITTFNTNFTNTGVASAQDARAVLAAANDLDDAVEQLSDGPVHIDANYGILLSIGHKFEGGAFVYNRRVVADGVVNNFANDIALLEEYVDAMEFIEAGGQPVDGAALYPNVFDAGGNLIDQTNNLNATATGSGVDIIELGMALSKTFNLFNREIAIGITPKMMQVVTYDFIADASSGDSEKVLDDNEDWDINLDIGMAHNFNAQWRLGLVVKNIRSLTYETALGNKIELEPQIRAGTQFKSRWGLYALDMDVIENEPVGSGSNSQMFSLGGEWQTLRSLKLRAGYSRNMKGEGNNGDGLYSGGLQWNFGGVFELTYAQGPSEQAMGLLLGWIF